jgi:hypothetical protein
MSEDPNGGLREKGWEKADTAREVRASPAACCFALSGRR